MLAFRGVAGGISRLLLTDGFRGGAPPGRRVSWRVGGRWRGRGWAVRLMTLFMGSPFGGPG
ncbi:hypothetical protein M878_27660 [Streptomyces roseochromogenus subsp. oscitans DS 12.976]|uniref:Uncharacterized protein n=1 Tax=Streptomyces roseochromogenus subsp. oscitans DS 12.976 TaxID=1352936 RepID=V6K1Q7_STRRC|nr:hypothetical protein M878_27660 [Streptomyces roseochromogenus subsp. oscitans DS 12.976]